MDSDQNFSVMVSKKITAWKCNNLVWFWYQLWANISLDMITQLSWSLSINFLFPFIFKGEKYNGHPTMIFVSIARKYLLGHNHTQNLITVHHLPVSFQFKGEVFSTQPNMIQVSTASKYFPGDAYMLKLITGHQLLPFLLWRSIFQQAKSGVGVRCHQKSLWASSPIKFYHLSFALFLFPCFIYLWSSTLKQT